MALWFTVIPVIRERPKIIKVVKKKTVIVECHVQSKFAPQCTWFKETTAVKEDSRHTVHVTQTKEGEFAVKLEIEDVKETDKGSYKLVAKNEKGETASQTVELTEIPKDEEEKPKPKGDGPKISKGLKSLVGVVCIIKLYNVKNH